MIVGYARVSTQDQNPEYQVDALEKAGCEQIFQEKVTGKLRERPELSQCLCMLRKGDTLIFWKLDRLARSLKDLVEMIHGLNEKEIGFKSLTESIDTTNSGGRLVFHIFGALAEFEHSLIRERTIAGLEAARARGAERWSQAIHVRLRYQESGCYVVGSRHYKERSGRAFWS